MFVLLVVFIYNKSKKYTMDDVNPSIGKTFYDTKEKYKYKSPTILTALCVTHFEISEVNTTADSNMLYIKVTDLTSHVEISESKVDASLNIEAIFVTLDTSQPERSLLNTTAP